MGLTQALTYLRLAREELRKELNTAKDSDIGKVTVLEAEVSHCLELGRRYVAEMKKEKVG